MKPIAEIIRSVNENQRILIVGHVSPDGDCFGSMFALGMELKRIGKDVLCCAGDGLTKKYEFMKDYVNNCSSDEFIERGLSAKDFDLVIAVDTADKYRVGAKLEPVFDEINNKISIDHHITNPGFSDINWVEERSATGELVYELLEAMNADFSEKTANALYAAIMTDTGDFTYSNTTQETHVIAGKLIEYGADTAMLSDEIEKKRSLGATKLIGKAITDMELYYDGKLAVMHTDYADIEACGALPEDCENLINFAREVETVEMAMLIREITPMRHKVSMRSKKYVDCASFAKNYGGGGHKFAAGCTLDGTMQEVMQTMIKAVEELI